MEDSPTFSHGTNILYFNGSHASGRQNEAHMMRANFVGGRSVHLITFGVLMIAVLLVDDHTYIRKGIRYLLESVPDMDVVDIASNGIEAVAKARALQPDVVVIDISMPLMDGMEATRQISASCQRCRILALSLFHHPEYVKGAVDAGAAGYVLKDAIGDELVEAIRTLYSGKRYFSRKVVGIIPPFITEE